MPARRMRILTVGNTPLGLAAHLRCMALHGWGSRPVGTVREAKGLLEMLKFEIVLAAENLPDGQGYDLSEIVAQRARSLLVAVALSASVLWLPVVLQGSKVLGQRALNDNMLETEVETLLISGSSRRKAVVPAAA